MDENEITQRLRDAGEQPVPGEVRSSHLTRMHAATRAVPRPKRFGRLAVAAAAFAGFALGSTGFAMAGALPTPAQQVAHDVLATVNVNVENPKNRGQCISAAARDNVDEAAKQAAKDTCKADIAPGRPDHAGQPGGKGNGKGRPDHAGKPGGPKAHPHEGNPCKGPPPWAGKGGKSASPADKEAFAATRAACPDDEGDGAADAAEDQREREAEAAEEKQEDQGQAERQGPPADRGPAEAPAGPEGRAEPAPELPGPLAPDAGARGTDIERAPDADPAPGDS